MARSIAFYRSLGFRIAKGGAEAGFTTLEAGGQSLNLTAEAAADGSGRLGAGRGGWWGRVIFHVDDVDACHRRAVEHGLHPEFASRDAPWGQRYFPLSTEGRRVGKEGG